jgi:nitrogen-specific signal transduction histidine kinase
MRFFRTEVWSYAVLLIILFAIATLAVLQILEYLEEPLSPSSQQYKVVAALLWALTLGFMFIAGAFGLWAIQFSAEKESRKRIGRFVDAMDYLSDGLLAVDGKGRITGSNPKAKTISDSKLSGHENIAAVFDCLRKEDVDLLLDKKEPSEVERELVKGESIRTFRFRSQPSEDLSLVMVSDVTSMEANRSRARQAARLQLIGQIARGVAHDFNNLLCGISGYASLLKHVKPEPAAIERSVDAITQNSERGMKLAAHLMELSQPALMSRTTDMAEEHVRSAAEALRNTLSGEWKVKCELSDSLPPVGLAGIQIEQVILNLGLLVSDALGHPGTVRIAVGKSDAGHLFNVPAKFAGSILINAVASEDDHHAHQPAVVVDNSNETGVIQSVVRSMLQEAGGGLDSLTSGDGAPVYRVVLPHGAAGDRGEQPGEIPQELKAYVAHWSVLVAKGIRENRMLDKTLSELQVNVDKVDNVMSALAHMENTSDLDAMILDAYLLGHESEGLLKAILKLHPLSGIVVLCENPESEPAGLAAHVVFESYKASPDRILMSMIEAKTLAIRRKT